MPMVLRLHHLFNSETMSILHPHVALERSAPPVSPLSEPQRRSLGHLPRPAGLKRYRCKEQGCKRTFNDLTGTLLDGSKRSVMHWMWPTFCCACRVHRGALPGSWGSMSAPAIGGVGGSAMLPLL